MNNLRNELMHYTNDLPDGADLKAEAVAVIERIAQYMDKDVLLNHSRPLALAYLALTEDVDSVSVVRCKGCKHYDMGVCLKIYSDGNVHAAAWQKHKPDDFCSYGERRDKQGCPRGQRGPLAVCPVCGGFDTSWNPDTDESFCKSCGFSTGKDGGNAEG